MDAESTQHNPQYPRGYTAVIAVRSTVGRLLVALSRRGLPGAVTRRGLLPVAGLLCRAGLLRPIAGLLCRAGLLRPVAGLLLPVAGLRSVSRLRSGWRRLGKAGLRPRIVPVAERLLGPSIGVGRIRRARTPLLLCVPLLLAVGLLRVRALGCSGTGVGGLLPGRRRV